MSNILDRLPEIVKEELMMTIKGSNDSVWSLHDRRQADVPVEHNFQLYTTDPI